MGNIIKNYYDNSQSNDIEINTPMSIDKILELRERAIRRRMAEDAVVVDAEVVEEKPTKPQYPFVTIPSLTDAIVSKIRGYLEGKTPSQAKDVMKPIRAAQDAGVIRRITFEEMKAAFPEYCPNSKASVSKYTKEDETPYIDEAFKDMVEEFRALKNC